VLVLKQLKENQDFIYGASIVLEKLKELKEDFMFNKNEQFHQIPDDFSSILMLIEEIREKLFNNKKLIESLREAVNILQGERQLLNQSSTTLDDSFTLEQYTISTPNKHKATIQKYITWFDSIQIPLKEIVSAASGEIRSSEIEGRYTLSQMREIICKVPEAITQLKRERAKDIKAFNTDLNCLRFEYETQKRAMKKELEESFNENISTLNSFQEELIRAKEQVKKLHSEKMKLEEQLKKSKEDINNLYEKGNYH